jgi:hypothetical protein
MTLGLGCLSDSGPPLHSGFFPLAILTEVRDAEEETPFFGLMDGCLAKGLLTLHPKFVQYWF